MSKVIDTKGALYSIFRLCPGQTKHCSITDQDMKGPVKKGQLWYHSEFVISWEEVLETGHKSWNQLDTNTTITHRRKPFLLVAVNI